MFPNFRTVFAAAALVAIVTGCGTTTPAMPNPVTEPVIDQPGQDIVRYRDAVIELLLESRFASDNLGEPWLILNVAFSGMTGAASMVDRDLVSVRTPDGRTIPLPPYSEFLSAYSTELASAARRAALASQPLDFTRANRRPCAINFMPQPGSDVLDVGAGRGNKTVCLQALAMRAGGPAAIAAPAAQHTASVMNHCRTISQRSGDWWTEKWGTEKPVLIVLLPARSGSRFSVPGLSVHALKVPALLSNLMDVLPFGHPAEDWL